eukprot:TRINITY_DN4742_c0_g3_i1.p1 TRINITY_DN4742_c0_g3~~TRINITY_DN4742_c0_g3_i1.p1  ORF type:complete len:150 (-),score=39.23 TRINITY_DN4742_c0_g3_i1:56-505(-)
MIKVIASLLLICGLALSQSPWSNCGGANDLFQIKTLYFSPNPPIIGQNVTIVMSGSLSQTITSGNLQLVLQYYEIWWHTVLNTNIDICTVDPSVSCPFNAGPYSFKYSLPIPTTVDGETVPSGDYRGTAVFTTGQTQIACVNYNIELDS